MTNWARFEEQAPEMASRIRARFESHRHHVLATLRSNGAPRVSGTEARISGGELWIGSMTGAVKVADLLRDGRCALHANPGDGTMTGGDAKIGGLAIDVVDPDERERIVSGDVPGGPFHLFRLEIAEAVLTSVHPDGDRLVIESWHPDRGVQAVDRY